MIFESIMNFFYKLLEGIIAMLPDLSEIVLPQGFTEWFVNIVYGAGYFLPLVDMFLMFTIWLIVTNWHIVWKTIQRIWDALPFT